MVKIGEGDVVRVAGISGPSMRVSRVTNYDAQDKALVTCLWFDNDLVFQAAEIYSPLLVVETTDAEIQRHQLLAQQMSDPVDEAPPVG